MHYTSCMQKKNTRHRPPRQRSDKPEPTSTKTASDDDEKEKNTGAGLDLGERAEHGVQVELVVLVQEVENTRGNPNPKRGLDFPSA